MVMANGFIPIKQLMKVNGLQQKNKVKELRHGLMDTFIKVNLKIVNGSGRGVLTFPDGSTYEGEWSKGFMNGQGTFTWADGKQKTGTWINGKLQSNVKRKII